MTTPAIGPEHVRRIGFALLAGATMFAAVAVAVPFFVGSPAHDGASVTIDPDQRELVRALSAVHALIAVGALVAAPLVARRAAVADGATRLRLHIVRWALLEGAALFGIVVVLLAGLFDLVPAESIWYANLASYVVFAALVLRDLVTLD